MKKAPEETFFLPRSGALRGLDVIAGLPPDKEPSAPLDAIARKLTGKISGPLGKPSEPTVSEDSREWLIHKRFAKLHEKHGRPFARFVGDLLDILLSGTLQSRLVTEIVEARWQEVRRLRAQKKNEEPDGDEKSKVVTAPRLASQVKIGGEDRIRPQHYLKRKSLLANLFLNPNEYNNFVKLMQQLEAVINTVATADQLSALGQDGRRQKLSETMERLKQEMTSEELSMAWALLDADDFASLEEVYLETRAISLVRPTFYEDLDKAYREAKKLLKVLQTEFEGAEPLDSGKREVVIDYLKDILEVYTHHHFVLKHFHHHRPVMTKREWELDRQELLNRIEAQRLENLRLREESRQFALDRDRAFGEKRAAQQELEEIRLQLQKLDPAEVARQKRATDAELNQSRKELEETREEEVSLRSCMRKLDEENQKLLQQLRDLKAIPDESDKLVTGLLEGKRVVIFGGIGRDHYVPLLKEAGVKDADFEWYEGYRTISQSRTAEIVRRCDLVVVITSYAGHLHTWQTRSTITDQQNLLFIHNSGTGTLRQQILEQYGRKT